MFDYAPREFTDKRLSWLELDLRSFRESIPHYSALRMSVDLQKQEINRLLRRVEDLEHNQRVTAENTRMDTLCSNIMKIAEMPPEYREKFGLNDIRKQIEKFLRKN